MKPEELKLTQEWDKTFPKSKQVHHSKVTFINRYGITLAADLFIPQNATGKLPASFSMVSGPKRSCVLENSFSIVCSPFQSF